MTTQPKPEPSFAEQEATTQSRVIWVLAATAVVGWVVVMALMLTFTTKDTTGNQMPKRTEPKEVTVYSDPPMQEPPPAIARAPKNVAKPATNTPPRAIEPAWVAPPLPSMTVAPAKPKRAVEPLTPAELDFQRQLADFERKPLK